MTNYNIVMEFLNNLDLDSLKDSGENLENMSGNMSHIHQTVDRITGEWSLALLLLLL